MNAVEAHFAVGNSVTPDIGEQQLRWCEANVGDETQMPEPTAAGYEEVLTHVGGVSLFLEHSIQPSEGVFSELHSMEFEAEVFSDVGGLSLFPEEGLGSTNEVCDAMLLKDVSGSNEVLTHVGGLSLFLEFDLDLNIEFEVFTCVGDCSIFLEPSMGGPTEVFDAPPTVDMDKVLNHAVGVPSKGCKLQQLFSQEMQQQGKINSTVSLPWDLGKQEAWIKGFFKPHAETCGSKCNLYVVSRSIKDIEAPLLTSDNVLDKMPSWRRGFSHGNSELPNLGRIPPWRRSAFSPWLGNTMRVIRGQHEGACFSSNPIELVIVRQRLWDPGIVAICESNLFIPHSGHFVQNLVKNTPPDDMQMNFIHWLAEDILRILVLLLRALLLVLLNDKDAKLEQAVHRNMRQFMCARKNTLMKVLEDIKFYHFFFQILSWLNSVEQYFGPSRSLSVQAAPVFVIAKWEHWESELYMRCDFFLGEEGIDLCSPFVLFTGRQFLVFQCIHKCQGFCQLAISAKTLQYRPWDPGLHVSVCAISVEITAAGVRDADDGPSFLRKVHCRIWSYIVLRLRHGQAVAWGQATFRRGGSVTPRDPRTPLFGLRLVVVLYGLGPASQRSEQEIYGTRGHRRGMEQNRNKLILLLSSDLLLPLPLIFSSQIRLPQVRRLPQATTVSSLYRPHAPILTGGNGV